MSNKDEAILNQKLRDFLEKEGPKKDGDCTLVVNERGKYFLIECGMLSTGQLMYTINDRFWYDWSKTFAANKWTVVYKKVI